MNSAYPWIGCECCKGTVWVPFRRTDPDAQRHDARPARRQMKCDRCGKRPERYTREPERRARVRSKLLDVPVPEKLKRKN
jgi:hypothetical protein